MEKLVRIFAFFVCLMFLFGCAGHRIASLDTANPNVIKHQDTNISLLQPSIGPNDLAQAQLTSAIAEQIRKSGQNGVALGKYTGVIVNQDPKKAVLVYHPELHQTIHVPSGGYCIIVVNEIPEYIHVRFSGEERNQKLKIFRKNKIYNGINTEFGARIES